MSTLQAAFLSTTPGDLYVGHIARATSADPVLRRTSPDDPALLPALVSRGELAPFLHASLTLWHILADTDALALFAGSASDAHYQIRDWDYDKLYLVLVRGSYQWWSRNLPVLPPDHQRFVAAALRESAPQAFQALLGTADTDYQPSNLHLRYGPPASLPSRGRFDLLQALPASFHFTAPSSTRLHCYDRQPGFIETEAPGSGPLAPLQFPQPETWYRAPSPNHSALAPTPARYPDRITAQYEFHVRAAHDAYLRQLGSGLCAEQARLFLPQGSRSSWVATAGLLDWARALRPNPASLAPLAARELARRVDTELTDAYPEHWPAAKAHPSLITEPLPAPLVEPTLEALS